MLRSEWKKKKNHSSNFLFVFFKYWIKALATRLHIYFLFFLHFLCNWATLLQPLLSFFFLLLRPAWMCLEQKQNKPPLLWVACQNAAAADADKDKSASAASHTLCTLFCAATAVCPTPLHVPFFFLNKIKSTSCVYFNRNTIFFLVALKTFVSPRSQSVKTEFGSLSSEC